MVLFVFLSQTMGAIGMIVGCPLDDRRQERDDNEYLKRGCSWPRAVRTAACWLCDPTTATSSTPMVKLDDHLVSRLAAPTSGTYQTPLDATPDLSGTTIYFTACNAYGAGVFQVRAAGGTATAVYTGKPFLAARGFSISPDGLQLFVADPTA